MARPPRYLGNPIRLIFSRIHFGPHVDSSLALQAFPYAIAAASGFARMACLGEPWDHGAFSCRELQSADAP